jgi:hypothetical protein
VNKPTEISNHLRITLPIVLSFIGLATMGTMEWSSLRGDVSDLKKSQWTVTDQLHWSMEFKQENPTINVPIPTVHTSPNEQFSGKATNSLALVLIK